MPTVAGWILLKNLDSFAIIPATMVILGAIFYPILKKIPATTESRRILWFYINIGIKMVLSLGVILFVALNENDKRNSLVFIITFFVFYILLMIFEIRCFAKVIKSVKNR